MDPVGVPTFTRRCANDTVLNGINIPENMGIVFDVLSVHYDKDLWGPVDPHTFYPLRY
jgi:cytochrome P450